MSFDKNHESPDKIVEPARRTTQVNLFLALGVLIFLVIGGIAIWLVTRNPPQDPVEASTPVPSESR